MNYPLVVSQADMEVIGAALQELPFKVAAPVIARLQAQAKAFEDAEAAKTKEPGGDGKSVGAAS